MSVRAAAVMVIKEEGILIANFWGVLFLEFHTPEVVEDCECR